MPERHFQVSTVRRDWRRCLRAARPPAALPEGHWHCGSIQYRLFLLDEADFPQHMTLQVYVSSWADNLELAMFPHEVTKTHLHRYRVTILGLTFILGVGNRISQNDCDACFVRSPLGGPVCVDPRMDVKIIEEAKRVAFASEAAKGLRILG